MKDLKLLVSSILIIISFFVWIFFEKQLNKDNVDSIKNEVQYVNIDINKSKIDVSNTNKNIYISINWKPLDEANLNLESICK